MRKRLVSVDIFKGIDNRYADSKAPTGNAVEEHNADRRLAGVWRPRMGLAKAYEYTADATYRVYGAGWGETKVGTRIVLITQSGTVCMLARTPDWKQEPQRGGYMSAPSLSLTSVSAAGVWLAATHNDDYGVAFNVWRDGALIKGEQASGAIVDDDAAAGTYLYEAASVTDKRISGARARARVVVP